MRRALCLAATLAALCAGCAARGDPAPPPAQARLGEAAARAAALARSGDYAAAALRYQEALRVARTIEDADAIAANAINLSIVYQRLGHQAAARSALAVVLEGEGRFPPRRILQAELRQAIVHLAAADTAAAESFAERAWQRCRSQSCELAAAIRNVQAMAALDAGRHRESLQHAEAAESAARARADRAETANALRIIGRARTAAGDPAGAIAPLEQALAIDRTLADARKILADLLALARASAAKGDEAAARAYSERALAVSRATRETPDGEKTEVRLR